MAKRNKRAAAAFKAKKSLTRGQRSAVTKANYKQLKQLAGKKLSRAQRGMVQRENIKQLKRLSGQKAVTKRIGPG